MNRKQRNAMVLMIWAMALMLVISACSNKGDNEPEPQGEQPPAAANTNTNNNTDSGEVQQTEQREETELRIVYWGALPDANDPNVIKGQELLKSKYPWMTIVYDPVDAGSDSAILEKLAALQAAGTPADLVWIQSYASYVRDGLLTDLTPYMEADADFKNVTFADGVLDTMKLGEATYALPRTISPMVVMVNKDLLEKYGMEMPGNDWTWDDFREMAKNATDPQAGDFGLGSNWFNTSFVAQMLPTANGHAPNLVGMNADASQSLMATPEVLQDLEWIQEFNTKDGSIVSAADQEQQLGDAVRNINPFLQGKVLLNVAGTWEVASVDKDAKFDWDVLPMPRGTDAQVTIQFMAGISIPSASRHKAEAFDYIKHMYSDEAQLLTIEQGNLPFVVSDKLNEALREVEIYQGKNIDAIVQTGTMCCVYPELKVPLWPDYSGAFYGPVFDGIFYNGQNVRETVVPFIEDWNRRTLEQRQLLGW